MLSHGGAEKRQPLVWFQVERVGEDGHAVPLRRAARSVLHVPDVGVASDATATP